MTTTEDLIAAVKHRRAFAVYGEGPAYEDISALLDALEAVYRDSLTGQAMHAHWQERAEKAEQERDDLRLVHTGQARLALSAVFLADVDGDEGVQAFRAEYDRVHAAKVLREVAERYASAQLTGVFAGRDDYTRAWLRAEADRLDPKPTNHENGGDR